jgi:class 3 adenylate cyclase
MRYHFADCVLDTDQYTLCRAGQLLRVRPKAFQILIYLLLHHDRVVTKQELAEQFWPEQFITDAVVENTLKAARQAVGDSGRTQTIIQTLRGVGYRVVAAVTVDAETPAVEPPEKPLERATPQETPPQGDASAMQPQASDAERRQLTVLFCDVVGSTTLSRQMELEDYLEIIQAYHRTCSDVIERFEGHIAQYLGDGLLAYFGYPLAHEDDAHRAIQAGLAIIAALKPLSCRLEQEVGAQLAVRLGIHTGLVIVGDIGAGERRRSLALGATPNLAAQLQSLAEPDTVVISKATARLIQGYFTLHALQERSLTGMATAMPVFRVIAPTEVHNRLEVAGAGGLTPMVNREAERALFLQHWEQVQEGRGRVIVLHGEAGIGKSRLVQAMRASLNEDGYIRLECRCSPYNQNTAWYPVIDLWHRILKWHDAETAQARLQKLETTLSKLTLPLAETLPLMANLLALPHDKSRFPPWRLSPQQQRERTFEIIVDMTLELASRQPVLFVVEDLHWADPSTLELLGFLVEQVPAARLCLVCTCRPSYAVTWGNRSYLFDINLGRLAQRHVEEMVLGITRGKQLPADVLAHVAQQTDGVPLFVEELTKVLLETAWLRDAGSQYELVAPLADIAIPATLHDALMARLDRLDTAKRVAQLGATLGG